MNIILFGFIAQMSFIMFLNVPCESKSCDSQIFLLVITFAIVMYGAVFRVGRRETIIGWCRGIFSSIKRLPN